MVHSERIRDWFDITAENDWFSILQIDGLNPPAATINTSTGGSLDGTFFNSARLNQRNIVITILPRGDIETNRRRLYTLFPVNQEILLRFTTGDRDVTITGYVESFEGSLCDFPQTFTISIICPRPFFEDHTVSTIVLSSTSTDAPTIRNSGDVKNGVSMRISISSSLSGEAVRGLTISNYSTEEHITLDMGLIHNDEIVINTISGELMAELRRSSYPRPINILKYMTSDSAWLKLKYGENNFACTTSNNTGQYVTVTISHINQFVGV